MTRNTVVGVTAFKNVESPQPGFGVARALKEEGYTVIGIDDTPITTAILAPYVDGMYLTKSMGSENILEFIEDLRRVKAETGMEIIIPCYDREVYFFDKCRSHIESIGLKMLIPSTDALKRASKVYLPKLSEVGILVPKTLKVSSESEVEEACKQLGFPLICKGVVKDAYIVNNTAEAYLYFQKIREIWHGGKGSVLFQEYVFGETITISGVADRECGVIGRVGMKKLAIDSKGTCWSGVTYKSEEVDLMCDKIIKHLCWQGPFELEFIHDIQTNRWWLFEINPRLPSWIYLGAPAGQNIPCRIVDIILGKKVEPKESFVEGLAFARYSEELIYPKEKLEQFKCQGRFLKPIFGKSDLKTVPQNESEVKSSGKTSPEITMLSSGKGATGKVPSYVKKFLKEQNIETDNTVEVSAAEELLFGDEDGSK